MELRHKTVIDNIHDPSWRVQNLYRIRNKQGKNVPLALNRTQKQLAASKNRFNMVLKGRQQGVSTYYLMKYLDRCMFRENYTAGIISHEQKSIQKLFRIVTYAYKSVPEYYKPQLDRGGGSKYEMFFPKQNSRIYVDLEIRSESLNALHVSEYGLMKNKVRFNASIEAVPADTGEISIESTPWGMNHFYDDWMDADFPYQKHFFPWFFHHENKLAGEPLGTLSQDEKNLVAFAADKFKIILSHDQLRWRRFKIKQKARKEFLTEHPENDVECFLTSGQNPLDMVHLNEILNSVPEPWDDDGTLRIWEKAEPGQTYVIGADTAEGTNSDYSVAVVLNKATRVQVAQLRGHMAPKVFAEKLADLGKAYTVGRGSPTICVERNNHGHAVLLWLDSHCQYDNIFEHDDEKPGWLTNKVTRPLMMDTLIDAVENDMISIRDKTTINELMTLEDNGGKVEALSGKHDDTVIATALALQMCIRKSSYLEDLMQL